MNGLLSSEGVVLPQRTLKVPPTSNYAGRGKFLSSSKNFQFWTFCWRSPKSWLKSHIFPYQYPIKICTTEVQHIHVLMWDCIIKRWTPWFESTHLNKRFVRKDNNFWIFLWKISITKCTKDGSQTRSHLYQYWVIIHRAIINQNWCLRDPKKNFWDLLRKLCTSQTFQNETKNTPWNHHRDWKKSRGVTDIKIPKTSFSGHVKYTSKFSLKPFLFSLHKMLSQCDW